MTFLKVVMLKQNLLAALKVSLFVGTVLNLINQGPAIWDGASISWMHLFMNYLVPFCVSSYSAAKNQMALKGGKI
ncbi:nitrate/nitrite transporter NrtS [Marinomonas algicola]|uniref:nitrate/nitrite transporter NrtS n=1 Tax=Marinomonas algicola TaxID=2773454 RepID=UPI00174DAB49|nr:nitrate/nitrite transporter NrtS [Marinomonas algicola]